MKKGFRRLLEEANAEIETLGVADAMRTEGGLEAVQLRVAEQYIAQFGELAKTTNTLILPANAGDVGSMIALAMKVITGSAASGGTPPPWHAVGVTPGVGAVPGRLR